MENGFIVGLGVVGQSTMIGLNIPKENWYDVSNEASQRNIEAFVSTRSSENRYYFICVPTPTSAQEQDLSMVKDAINKVFSYDAKAIVVIRSTVLPGTTRELINEHKTQMIHFPEFLTESEALKDSYDPDVVIFGSNSVLLSRDFKSHITKELPFSGRVINTNTDTSELVKYAMNTFFGMKVILGNILYDIAKEKNSNYEIVKSVLENHKWGSKNGWNPFHAGYRGFGGKCLPKDIEALSGLDKSGFLENLIKVNHDYNKKV